MRMTTDRPDFGDLYLLTVLSQTRSFTQAAHRLGVSKASVSVRITELEKAIGVPLVRRSTRSVVLTDAGQQLVNDIDAAYEQIERSVSAARDLAGTPRGLVRVTSPVALGRQHLAPMIPPFLAAHPEIRIELDLSDRLVNLSQQGFDLAVRHTNSPPETHVAVTLTSSRSLLVAGARYLKRRPAPQHPQELAAHDCLLYLREPAERTWSFVQRGGGRNRPRVDVNVNGPFKANNSEVLREAILAGLGIGLLPDFSAAAEIASGRLQPVLADWQPLGFFGDRIYAIRPATSRVPKAVRLLVDHLKEGFRQLSTP